jgi:adenylate kinase family enzyme
MEQEKLKRIAIIGLPGSGKSTFAAKLGNILNIPVHHLDRHMFEGNKKRDKQEFLSVKEALVNEEFWIIEGCSLSTLEMRFARADTIIYFHLPRLLCIWRVCKRLFTFDKRIADTGCLNGINWSLIKYIWNFNRDKRQNIEDLRKQYPNVEFLIFCHSQDPHEYLEKLNKYFYTSKTI